MLRIDFLVSGMQVCKAGQLKAMNSFQEKMSTALWLSPSNGQASSGTVACAEVIELGQVEAAQPVPPLQALIGGAALCAAWAPSAMKRVGAMKRAATKPNPSAMRPLIM